MTDPELTIQTPWQSHSGLSASSKAKEPSRWWMGSLAYPPWRSLPPVGVGKPPAPPTASDHPRCSPSRISRPGVVPQGLFLLDLLGAGPFSMFRNKHPLSLSYSRTLMWCLLAWGTPRLVVSWGGVGIEIAGKRALNGPHIPGTP